MLFTKNLQKSGKFGKLRVFSMKTQGFCIFSPLGGRIGTRDGRIGNREHLGRKLDTSNDE